MGVVLRRRRGDRRGSWLYRRSGRRGGDCKVPVYRIRLSPGERADVLINLNGMNGQTIYLMSYASELPSGVQGGPTMPMPPGSPPMDSPLNGIDFNILKLNIGAQTSSAVTTIPSVLAPVNPYPETQADLTRRITFTADSMMVMDGPFYFNNLSFDMMRIDYKIPLGQTEIWTLMDSTMVAHPFHMHDVQFFVLDRDGNLPPAEERGWKDVVLVQPNETVRIIMKFTDFTDSLIPYMYHCHILMHEDDGMMGQFVVMPQGWTGVPTAGNELPITSIFPNPANSMLSINSSGSEKIENIIIFDILGNKVIDIKSNQLEKNNIDVSMLLSGTYIIQLRLNNQVITKKFLKE